MVTTPVGIGILGSTSLVSRVAVVPAIEASVGCTVAATASLSDPGADYASYEALLEDDSVEAVYIPLPNSLHREWTERAAAAGKHVLCEKPLAPSANDADAMNEACVKAGVVLMEAYMTRFHPRDHKLRELVQSGTLGELLFATSAFTGVLDRPSDHRWHPEMGGGALLDLGIYCLTPLLLAAGADPARPEVVREANGAAHRNEFGVDSSFSGWLDFGDGRTGSFQCSLEAPERQLLELVGTETSLFVEQPFTPGPGHRTITVRERSGRTAELTTGGGDPYELMVEHFAAVVRGDAALERTPEESIGLQRLVDRLQWSAEPGAS